MPQHTTTDVHPARLTAEQLEAIRVAVYLSGGCAKVARVMGYKTGESIRRFCIPGQAGKAVPSERVEDFRKATGNRLTLAAIRPDLYGGLKADALGYQPRARKGEARA